MTVELLYWRGCPSWERAIELVREQMTQAGVDAAGLVIREVIDEDDVIRERFPGSPTVRVDGRDVQEPGDDPGGLTCRVYTLADGRISALPDPADVAAAIAAAQEGVRG